MYEISLKDFRGFHETEFVPIRPITILIGENSAGKSSFLAALKYIRDFVSMRGAPSFNKDPFQLGTFHQIAHYRGGKPGRAKEFVIKFRADVKSKSNSSVQKLIISALFKPIEHHALIERISISHHGDTLAVDLTDSGVGVSISIGDGRPVYLNERIPIPKLSSPEMLSYLPFFIREIRFTTNMPRRTIVSGSSKKLQSDDSDSVNVAVRIASLVDTLARQMRGHSEATSAIRTKPLRTYTPGFESRDGEGSHVPFEMANLFRAKNKDPWKKIKSSIDSFGLSSEMFKEISIKSFGLNTSDPFQIQFSSDGPKTNIVDLGYGTSQVVPIIYSVAVSPANSLFLIQQPEVHLHPKAQAALGSFFVDSYVDEKKEFILETHSDFIVDRIRNAILQGRISRQDVSILFFERRRLDNSITEIALDDKGFPTDPPEQYRAFFIDEQLRIMGM